MATIPTPMLIVCVFFSTATVILGILAYWKNQLLKRGIRLTLRQMCAMSVRKTLSDDMLNALELADKNKFFIKPHYLEAHLIAGGNPYNMIKIIVEGKERGEEVSFREAASMDLANISLAEAKKLYADHEAKQTPTQAS